MSQIIKKHPAKYEDQSLSWLEVEEPHHGVSTFELNSFNLANEADLISTHMYDLNQISSTEQAIFWKESYGINDPDYLKVLDKVCMGNPTFEDCGMLAGFCQTFPNDASCLVQGPIWNWKPWMVILFLALSVFIGISIGASKTETPSTNIN
jgi:hypothetical protein